jgi:hypothetical protein
MGFLDRLQRLNLDPVGISQEFTCDADGDVMVVRSVQDVEPILKANAAARHEAMTGNGGYSPSRELRRVASVPNVIIHQWLKEGVNPYLDDDWDEIAARLDSSEYSQFRTAPGVVSNRVRRSHPTTRGW